MASAHVLGILFGLLTMTCFAVGEVLSKKALQYLGRKNILFYRGILSVVILVIALFTLPLPYMFSLPHFIGMIFVGLLGAVPIYMFYKALGVGKVGVVSPLSKSSVLVTLILSFIFLGERLSSLQTLLVGMIIAGIILSSINPKDFIRNGNIYAGASYALIAAGLWGFLFFVWKYFVVALGPLFTAVMIESGVVIGVATLMKKQDLNEMKHALQKKKQAVLGLITTLGVIVGAGTMFYTLGINIAPVSIVMPINSTSPFLAGLLAAWMFKERLKPIQYLGGMLIVAGVALLFIV